MPAKYPDEVLPPLQVGLPDLVTYARELHEDKATDDLIELMLAGRHYLPDDGDDAADWEGSNASSSGPAYIPHRVFVNAAQAVPSGQSGECSLKGDFDSLIGFSNRIPITVSLAVFPVTTFKLTLKKPIFIDMVVKRGGKDVKLPAHKVANVCIGQFDDRSQVRMFFPGLVNDDGSPGLTQDDLATIYDCGILPAVHHVIPLDVAHWPPSYKAAMALYRDTRGQFHFGKVDIPEYSVDLFAETLCDNLAEFGRFENALFQIELRGTKGRYQFALGDAAARENAFNLLTESLELNLRNGPDSLSDWYVDIGVEVIRPFHVVQWATAAHELLLAHALPSLTPIELSKLHDGSNFDLDVSGHVFDLGGFRCHPGARGKDDEVVHINVYTTDKTVIYQPGHAGVFGPHSGKDTYPGPFPGLLTKIEAMADVFAECAGSKNTTQDGTARFEIRVSALHSLTALTTFPEELLNHSTVCIPNDVWWDYKFYRVAAINYVLKDVAGDPPEARATPSSLTLVASLLYMLNAMMSRPHQWSAERHLAEVAVMRVPRDCNVAEPGAENARYDAADMVPVRFQQGLFFLCGIMRDKKALWWRLPENHPMERAQLCALYRAANLADLATNMGATGIARVNQPANPLRLSNRRLHTTDIQFLTPELIVPLGLKLSDAAITVRGGIRLSGPDIMDVDSENDEVDLDVIGPDVNLDDLIARIWAQFAVDLIEVSPNYKSRKGDAYTTLSPEERIKVTIDLYKRPVFPFRAVWWNTRDDWTLQFDRLFPPCGAIKRKMQSTSSCRYYQDWHSLISRVEKSDVERIRKRLRPLFDQLHWLPWTTTDKMWSTTPPKGIKGIWSFLSLENDDDTGATKTGVCIAVNTPKAHKSINYTLGNVFAEEEEEEEELDPRHQPPTPIPIRPGASRHRTHSPVIYPRIHRDTPRLT